VSARVDEALGDIVKIVTSELRSVAGSMRNDSQPDLRALSDRLYALCDVVVVKSFDALNPPKEPDGS
jgi:hypothetical protein